MSGPCDSLKPLLETLEAPLLHSEALLELSYFLQSLAGVGLRGLRFGVWLRWSGTLSGRRLLALGLRRVEPVLGFKRVDGGRDCLLLDSLHVEAADVAGAGVGRVDEAAQLVRREKVLNDFVVGHGASVQPQAEALDLAFSPRELPSQLLAVSATLLASSSAGCPRKLPLRDNQFLPG